MTGLGAAGGGDGFDLTEWLAGEPGSCAPPEETALRTDADGIASGTTDPTDEGVAFADWHADGDGGLQLPKPADTDDRAPSRSTDDPPTVPHAIPASYRPSVHPALAATVALFLTAATLAVLTVGGVLPPLGPATGLPA